MGKNNWHYRTQRGDAGLNKKPPRFKDLGEHSVGIFVREVLQNNLDAAKDNEPIHVEFTVSEWNKNDIETFFDFLGNRHIELLKKSAENPDPAVAHHLKSAVDIINGKLKTSFAITVSEKNCIGLIGPVRESGSEKSHFDALMRKVENNEAKKETSNTGGTWGKGSSIFTYTSSLWTWFSYSRLSVPWKDPITKEVHFTRFIGRCMLAPFFDLNINESFLGDAWFCDLEKLNSEKIDAYPFINDKADEFAKKLNLPERKDDPGTTFFVPFFSPVLENTSTIMSTDSLVKEFATETLKNWFIPLHNGILTVTIKNESQKIVLDKLFLTSIPELKYKLQLLDWKEKGYPAEDKRFIREIVTIDLPALKADFLNDKTAFAKKRQPGKAELLIRLLEEDEDFKDNWETINKVGLSRNKGMIITYEEMIDHKSTRTESLLLTGLLTNEDPDNIRRHFDLFLGYSENPAHNTWCRRPNDYDRCFLDRFEGQRPKPEASINHLFNELFRIFKKLVETDEQEKDNKDICSIFKKLAKLKGRGGDSTSVPLFSLRSIEETIDNNGRYLFTKRIVSNSDINIAVSFKSYVYSLEGERDKDFDVLGIPEFSILEVLDEGLTLLDQGTTPTITLSPEEERVITIRTCSIDANPFFKNLDPFVKASAKPTIYE